MNLKIKFYPDGQWEGGGILPRHLKDFSSLSEWIKFFLSEVKDLKKLYLQSIQDDNRLLGQEKADIVIEADEIIGGLLLLRQYLSPRKAVALSSDDGNGQQFNIRLLDSTWTGSGRLGFSEYMTNLSFLDLHNEVVMRKIRELFLIYGESVSDRKISDEELEILFTKIDSLFCDFLAVERIILYTNRTD